MTVKIIKGGGEVAASKALTVGNALGVQADKTSHFTVIKGGKVLKQDKEILQGSDIDKDDAFEPFYFDHNKNDTKATVLRPPYQPTQLALLTQRNNSLAQLITAMEVNIDGTGWVVEKKDIADDEDPEDDKEIDRLTSWFDEPFPRVSMTTLRRNIRRDLEKVGYGFIEVLRSIDGELMFLKRVDADMMRLVKLDDAVAVEETVMRDGKEMDVMMHKRERRFAQVQGKRVVYFKEYAASRELDRNTGMWAGEGETIDVKDRATEVLFFTIHEDTYTSYGVPRWINNIPSVLGSRKAEELNLDFFNSGGLPPALIFIQGGELTPEVRKQVQSYLSGRGSSMHRGGVIEVHATGGSIDSTGTVKVTVERFGSERMQDSMFENYDLRCEERVRGAFRLPPIFVGKAQDYSFATAFASYTVAEAQVFKPERDEFDEVINNTVMRELDDSGEYIYRSMPLTVNDVAMQLEAIGVVAPDLTAEQRVMAVNEVTGLTLKVNEDAEDVVTPPTPFAPPGAAPAPGAPAPTPGDAPTPGAPAPSPVPAAKMDTFDMMHLVNAWCTSILDPSKSTPEAVKMVEEVVKRMDPATRQQFDSYSAMRLMGALDYDFEGGVELVGAAALLHTHEHTDDHGS